MKISYKYIFKDLLINFDYIKYSIYTFTFALSVSPSVFEKNCT